MKTRIFPALVVCAALAMAGCKRDNAAAIDNTFQSPNPSLTVDVSGDTLQIGAMTADTTIQIRANIWWEIESMDQTWCQVTGDDQQHFGVTPLKLTFEPNLGEEPRTVHITIGSPDGNAFQSVITIIQNTAAPFAISQEIEAALNSVDNSISFGVMADTLQALVTSNVQWVVSSDKSWCTFAHTATDTFTATLDGSGADCPLLIAVADNDEGVVRYATITLADKADPSKVLMTFNIKQAKDFPTTTIQTVNTVDQLNASWDMVAGAAKYILNIYSPDNVLLGSVDCGTNLSIDLLNFAAATGVNYVGDVLLEVVAQAKDPAINSTSEPATINTLFGSGTGRDASSPLSIDNPRHMANISKVLAPGNLNYYYYKLNYDIAFSNAPFTPIGTATAMFVGDFDGGGHTISGAAKTYAAGDNLSYGFFGYVTNPPTTPLTTTKIHDLVFSGCKITPPTRANSWTAGLSIGHCVGINYGAEICNITVNNCTIGTPGTGGTGESPRLHLGGVVGYNFIDNSSNEGGYIHNCQVSGGSIGDTSMPTTYNGNFNNNVWYFGGITGFNYAGGTIAYCDNLGTSVIGGAIAGGITGANCGTVSHCNNKGNIAACAAAGGISGGHKNNTIAGAADRGDADGTSPVIEYCYNEGTINIFSGNGPMIIGGIAGNVMCKTATVNFCFNRGDVVFNLMAENPATLLPRDFCGAAGVVGSITSGTVSNCYNTGTVRNAMTYVGGAGYAMSPTIKWCFAGIIGFFSNQVVGSSSPGPSSLNNCYSTGAIDWSGATPIYQTGGNYSDYGALAACVRAPATFTATSCYYLNTLLSANVTQGIYGVADAAGACEGKSASDLQSQATFAGWTFAPGNWVMGSAGPVIDSVGQ